MPSPEGPGQGGWGSSLTSEDEQLCDMGKMG